MFKIAVFVSGRGSNLRAIHNYFREKSGKAGIFAVISNNTSCPALEFAENNNIDTFVVASNDAADKVTYSRLITELNLREIDLIVLAGFLKKIPDKFVEAFEYRIINIHPALLPSFGGAGMYGDFVHKAVFKSSCKVSGPTVHFVNKVYDDGLIIAQRAVDIANVENWREIATVVLEEEHRILPWVVEKFVDGKVQIQNNRVVLE